jgi:Flp pilus assembly protein TadD
VRDKAFDYLTEGVRQDPTSAALHDALARAWRDWGFPDRGLTAAHRAVYYAPTSAEARNTLGTVLWALGQRTEAREAFEQAAELAPRAWYAWRNLCEAAMAEGRTKDATAMCRYANVLRKTAAETAR